MQNCSNFDAGEFAGGLVSFCGESGVAPPVCGACAPPWGVLGFDCVVVCGVVVVAVEVDVSVPVAFAPLDAELSTVGVFASPGTVSVGAVVGSGSEAFLLLPPQAARNGTRAVRVSAKTSRRAITSYPSIAGSRRPHVGQSGTSFGASCSSEHPHSRRFSTAQGSRLSLGASGSTFPTTVNSSPVSRSTYTAPGSTSRMISRSLRERRRYSWGRGIGARIYKATPRERHNAALVRILVFHSYLLRGTGSNVYNASLVAALAKLGHEVHLFCQDRHARELPFVDAVGTWDDGQLRVETIREPVRITAYLPDIGRILPVYVLDQYEGFDAKTYPDLTDDELDHYISVNAAAVREVAELANVEIGLANHMVMGPVILARGLDAPYAVKIHGSALTYVVEPHPERFLPYAREGLEPARAVLVGSRHTAEGLWRVTSDPAVEEKTRLGPPGVDADEFIPRDDAAERLRSLADRLGGADAAGWGGEAGAADALRALDPARDRIVSFVGKLIVSKGVDLLVAAWPLVTQSVPDARLVVVGFGTYRDGIERLAHALRDGDLDDAREIARLGRELEGGPPGELRFLRAFLDRLDDGDPDRRARYLEAAAHGLRRIHFTGRLEHSDLPDLLPACQAQVVPSTWPEAFGMVAAEAASCGALPVSAAHSGLAEVSKTLAGALPEELRPLLSFELADDAVEQIADRLIRWLQLDPGQKATASKALSDIARERFSWEGVARGVVDAAEGRLDALPLP